MIDLPENADALKDLLLFVIECGESGDVTRTAMNTTNSSLIELVKKILNVRKNESFMDCFCGFNKTMLNVDAKSYKGYDINCDSASIAFMVAIMSGKTNFVIENIDYYSIEHANMYDKIFADGPIAGMLSDEYNYRYGFGKKSDIYNVLLPLMDLKNTGKAVITCAAGTLFSTQKVNVEMRKRIMDDLVAVVSLPPLWSGTGINTNILVFDRANTCNYVNFIDASNTGILNKQTRQYSLPLEIIDKIISCLNGEKIEGFSTYVNKEKILSSDDISLFPARYIEKKMNVSYRKVEEIECELKEVYSKLLNLIKE